MGKCLKNLLCVWIVTICLIGGASALDVFYSGECGENATYVMYEDGSVVISGSGSMCDYEYNSNRFYHEESPFSTYASVIPERVTSVTIEEGITRIGNRTFAGCSALKTVTLPSTLTSIGDHAFCYCGALESISLPDGISEIAEFTFDSCGFQSFRIPSTVTTIKRYAFQQCGELKSIVIPENVTYVEGSVFWGCRKLESVSWPKTEIKLDEYGRGTLAGTFRNCDSLLRFDVDEENPDYRSVDGILFNKDMTSLILFPSMKPGAYVVPNEVRRIESYAFQNCSALTKLTVPYSVEQISSTFENCKGLTEVIFEGSRDKLNTMCPSLAGVENVYCFDIIADYQTEWDRIICTCAINSNGDMMEYHQDHDLDFDFVIRNNAESKSGAPLPEELKQQYAFQLKSVELSLRELAMTEPDCAVFQDGRKEISESLTVDIFVNEQTTTTQDTIIPVITDKMKSSNDVETYKDIVASYVVSGIWNGRKVTFNGEKRIPLAVSFTKPYLPSRNGWGFSNAAAGVDVLSEKLWYYVLGDSWKNQAFYQIYKGKADRENGVCYGMALASALTYLNRPPAREWGRECAQRYKLNDLRRTADSFQWTPSEFIQAMWIYQFAPEASKQEKKNRGKCEEIIERTRHFQNTNQDPIIVSIADWLKPHKLHYAWHTLLPYAVEDISKDTVRVYVYDCNRTYSSSYSDKSTYIDFTCRDGKVDSWSFKFNDNNTFTSKSGKITYLSDLERIANAGYKASSSSAEKLIYDTGNIYRLVSDANPSEEISVENGCVSGDENINILPLHTPFPPNSYGYSDLTDSATPVAFYVEDESLVSVLHDATESVETVIADDKSDFKVCSDSKSSVEIGTARNQFTIQVTPGDGGAEEISMTYQTNQGNTAFEVKGRADGWAVLSARSGSDAATVDGFQTAVVTVTHDGESDSQTVEGGRYTVDLNDDGQMNITKESETALAIDDMTISDNKVSVNVTGNVSDAMLVVAAYKEQGQFLRMAKRNLTAAHVTAGATNVPLDLSHAFYVTAFILSNDDAMKPLCAKRVKHL